MPGISFTLSISKEEPNEKGETIYEASGGPEFPELILYGPEGGVLGDLVPTIKNLCKANHGFEATLFEVPRPHGSTEDMTTWVDLPVGRHRVRVW